MYTWFSWNCFTCSQNNFQNNFQFYYQHLKLIGYFKLIESNPYQLNCVDSPENIVPQNLLSLFTPIVQVFCHLSSLTIVYSNLVLIWSPLTLLVTIYGSFRPPSHHTVLCILHSSQFRTKLILLKMHLVCLVSLPFLSIHTAGFIWNIMRFYCSGVTNVSFLISSLFRIMNCDKYIAAQHALLY